MPSILWRVLLSGGFTLNMNAVFSSTATLPMNHPSLRFVILAIAHSWPFFLGAYALGMTHDTFRLSTKSRLLLVEFLSTTKPEFARNHQSFAAFLNHKAFEQERSAAVKSP